MASADAVIDFRPASIGDIDALLHLETICFQHDRLSRRSFRHHIRSSKRDLTVALRQGQLLGYGLVLYHQGTRLARMYSLAVSPEARGLGVGRGLMRTLEQNARRAGRHYMRLEVATNNTNAIALYESEGYRPFGEYLDYYEDHSNALRMHKRIRRAPVEGHYQEVPWYPQSTEFTCGPASLLMGMASLNPNSECSLTHELDLWREATTIFMTSGHGGCHPLGLGLAAVKRGFKAQVHLSTNEPLFLDGVRSDHKKAILRQVHQQFVAEADAVGVQVVYDAIALPEIEQAVAEGAAVLVLVSTFRLDGKKAPHWVVLTGIDDDCLFVHDPDIDEDEQIAADCQHIPIAKDDFDKMAVFGVQRLRAAVVLRTQDHQEA